MKPSDVIRRGWCRRALALDSDGQFVKPGSTRATAHCLIGACVSAGVDIRRGALDGIVLRQVVRSEAGRECGLTEFNDVVAVSSEQVARVLENAGL